MGEGAIPRLAAHCPHLVRSPLPAPSVLDGKEAGRQDVGGGEGGGGGQGAPCLGWGGT